MSSSQAFMGDARWRASCFDGSWRAAAHSFAVTDKSTNEELSRLGLAAPADVAHAGRTAVAAQTAWAETPPDARAAVFRRAAQQVEKCREELAVWIVRESGSLRAKADMELRSAVTILNASAAMLAEPCGLLLPSPPERTSMARRMPHGIVGVISPFNFPLTLAIRAVAPALAVGNAVLLKPDPQTAVSGGVLIARLFEEAGLPAGVLHVLPGGADVGEAICTDVNVSMVAFTGSTAAGRKVGALCGAHLKKVALELGGKNSLIVLEDADLDAAASGAAFGAWMHQGQICMATGRILAHASIAEALTERLRVKAERIQVGDPFTGAVGLGPLINERQRDWVHGIVNDSVAAGARLIAGGKHDGLFYRPTVLADVVAGMRAFDDEVFGPVASVTPFTADAEAVALANTGDYGLGAAVMSHDAARAMHIGKQLKAGLLHINDQTVLADPHAPFGGVRMSGNGGRVGGIANWEEFTQWQWITSRDKPPAYPF